jgi:hypothetical protein
MSATTRFILIALAAAGAVIPWTFHISYLLGGGSFAPSPFLAAVSVNPLVAGITWDVYLAAAAFSVWLLHDAPRQGMRHRWLYVLLTFGVGLAVSLPLYLALRARSLEAAGDRR